MNRILLIFFLVISLVQPINVIAETDSTPPEFKSLSLDKQSIYNINEDFATATIEAIDQSGISRLEVVYQHTESNKTFTIPFSQVKETIYSGMINLSELGQYEIQQIIIEDHQHNITQVWNSSAGFKGKVSADLMTGNLEVIDYVPSFTSRDIKDIETITEKTDTGLKVITRVYMNPIKGIQLDRMSVTYSSLNNEELEVWLSYQNGYFEGTFTPSKLISLGTWKMTKLVLNPNHNPLVLKDIPFSNITFDIDKDRLGEIFLNDYYLEKNELLSTDYLNLHVNVKKNDDAYYSIGAVYESPITKRLVTIQMDNNYSTDQYSTMITLGASEPGLWKFKYFVVRDSYITKNFTIDNPDKLDFNLYSSATYKPLSVSNILWYHTTRELTIKAIANADTKLLITYYHPVSGERVILSNSLSYYRNLLDRYSPRMVAGNWMIEKIVVQDMSYLPNEIVIWNEKLASDKNQRTMDLSGFDLYKSSLLEDVKAPFAPIVNNLTDKTTFITGKAEPNSKVNITINRSSIDSVFADANGSFKSRNVELSPDAKVTVTATDWTNNTSRPTNVVVKDVTPPPAPIVNKVTNRSTTITGKAQPGAFVTVKTGNVIIGKGTAYSNGTYTIKIKVQKAGTSIVLMAADKSITPSKVTVIKVGDAIPPNIPKVNKVTSKTKYVTGKTEPYALIEIKLKSKRIAYGKANSKGDYKISIKPIKKSSILNIYTKDQSGNISKAVIMKVSLKVLYSGKINLSFFT